VNVDSLMAAAKDTATVGRVFGEPIERDGVVLIPVAIVVGGGGGGSDDRPEKKGSGGGFGVWARPLGVYVIRGGQVEFRPALDALTLTLGAAFLVSRVLRMWTKRRS